MVMTDQIEPALTPEEWAAHQAERPGIGDGCFVSMRNVYGVEIVDGHTSALGEKYNDDVAQVLPAHLPALIALANAALPDDDARKITRDTITGIRETALLAEDALAREYGRQVEFQNGQMREQWGRVPLALLAMVRRTHALADALESYLPPE